MKISVRLNDLEAAWLRGQANGGRLSEAVRRVLHLARVGRSVSARHWATRERMGRPRKKVSDTLRQAA